MNGVILRLQAGKMNYEAAVNTCMELSEKIDNAVSYISMAITHDNMEPRREINVFVMEM